MATGVSHKQRNVGWQGQLVVERCGCWLTSTYSRPAIAPRSMSLGACVASLGGVDLPSVVSSQQCRGGVDVTRLPCSRAQDAGG